MASIFGEELSNSVRKAASISRSEAIASFKAPPTLHHRVLAKPDNEAGNFKQNAENTSSTSSATLLENQAPLTGECADDLRDYVAVRPVFSLLPEGTHSF